MSTPRPGRHRQRRFRRRSGGLFVVGLEPGAFGLADSAELADEELCSLGVLGPDGPVTGVVGGLRTAGSVTRPDQRTARAVGQAAALLEGAGRVEEAITWLQTCADAGNTSAVGQAVRLLEKAGRVEESKRLRWFGWEQDGSIAECWEVASGETSGGDSCA